MTNLKTIISPDRIANGAAAAALGASLIRETIKARGAANIIVATGASQFARDLRKCIATGLRRIFAIFGTQCEIHGILGPEL